ncbi:fatty acid desaturase [bacterium]|nr:fatty acid desaturase [bacterium]
MNSDLQHLHEKNSIAFHRAGIYAALFFASAFLAIVSWEAGYWPITILFWLVIGHLGHVNLFVLHEASHYLLHPNRYLNEIQGIFVGTFSLVPLSSYRHVHGHHHVHLAQEGDIELWPYTDPQTSRPFRTFAAAMELLLGYIWTPAVFLRGCIVSKKLPPGVKTRLFLEYGLCFVLWALILSATAYFGVWNWFLVGFLIPSLLTGSMQTARRFIEHMGLYGDTVDTATRTIHDRSLLGRFFSFTILNGDIHGPHHLHAKVPQSHLPQALEIDLREGLLTPTSVYPNYWLATKDMLRELSNPRIGKHWLAQKQHVDRDIASSRLTAVDG